MKPVKKRKLVLHFKELEGRGEDEASMLILNKTNAVTVAGMYGPATREWIGCRVTLFPDLTVEAFGKVVGGVRIRGRKPAAPTGRQQPRDPVLPPLPVPSRDPAGAPEEEDF